jgi:hypothetical protein
MIVGVLCSFCTIPFVTGFYSNDFLTEALGSFMGSMFGIWLIRSIFEKYRIQTDALMSRHIAIPLFGADLYKNHRIPDSYEISEDFVAHLAHQNQILLDSMKTSYETDMKNTFKHLQMSNDEIVRVPAQLANLLVVTINAVNHTIKVEDCTKFIFMENVKWMAAIYSYGIERAMNFIANILGEL